MEVAMVLIPLVVIVGPTASGKTRLAVDVALKYNGEVVSADSMQIYRGMNIGTAKPTVQEMRGVPHHMIDIADPTQSFSVADYVAQAKTVIEDIHARGRLPVLAGGTGLYISSLVNNIDFGKTQRDDNLRAQLREKASSEGGQALLDILSTFDPLSAARLHPNNTGRIIRAIEVYMITGSTMTELQKRSRELPAAYNCCKLGLFYDDRSLLYDKINARVDSMLLSGLLLEAEKLLKMPDTAKSTSMQAIGYKELAEYLAGASGLVETVELIKRGTRRYAKRQMTWFRRDEEICRIDAGGEYENICKQAYKIIDKWSAL
jgi:tRNA dimethylallyltransferase